MNIEESMIYAFLIEQRANRSRYLRHHNEWSFYYTGKIQECIKMAISDLRKYGGLAKIYGPNNKVVWQRGKAP